MPLCPQAYTDELVELHRRLMALRERNVLQQVQTDPCPKTPKGMGLRGVLGWDALRSIRQPSVAAFFSLRAW